MSNVSLMILCEPLLYFHPPRLRWKSLSTFSHCAARDAMEICSPLTQMEESLKSCHQSVLCALNQFLPFAVKVVLLFWYSKTPLLNKWISWKGVFSNYFIPAMQI